MDELFGPEQAARWIVPPGDADDKYSRGVLGVITGSTMYPGAAVLGVEAALQTGVGMVRYLGPDRPTQLVLRQRPEAVAADGRVQAWLIGSGQDATRHDEGIAWRIGAALAEGRPTLLDGGAIDRHADAAGPLVITPHAGELARALHAERAAVESDPAGAATDAAARFGCTVLLKGATTHVATPDGGVLRVRAGVPWLSTAGSGDALAGILGALLATNHRRIADDAGAVAPIAAAAAVVHGLAADRASGGGPFTILALCRSLPRVVADLLVP